MSGLRKAINILGSQASLASAIGTTQQTVSNWLKSGFVSARFVIPIETATQKRVTRHELRPDLYPDERAA